MVVLWAGMLSAWSGIALPAQQMPTPREMSGRPLPDGTLPAGTVSVRVVRGGFDKDIPNQPVTFTIDGQNRVVNTDEGGRALVSGVRAGSSVSAHTTVDAERLDSQTFAMGSTGMRIALVATDPGDVALAAEDKALASAPAVNGTVVLGPESRVVVELGEDGLTVFYLLEVVNTKQTPVDIGGPLIFELPQGARGVSMLPDSSPQGSANGPRIIVTGPFAPGATKVEAAYELPYRGPAVRLEQVWPATLQQMTLFVEQYGALDVTSPDITGRSMVTGQQKPFISASGPAIEAGKSLTLDFSGLPHRSLWPRWVALALACVFISWGLWTLWTAPARRRV